VVDQPDREGGAPHLEGVDTDDRPADALAHVRVHSLDDRHDGHEEGHRDDDAEQGEEGAELVAPRGVEGLQDGFGKLHRTTKLTAERRGGWGVVRRGVLRTYGSHRREPLPTPHALGWLFVP